MADNKYRYPPSPENGSGTFSDNLVGLQITDGGGLTQGNFEFTNSVIEKVDRTFSTGTFSKPISLSDLSIKNIDESKKIFSENFRVYPNYDISQITNFTLYGSVQKRLSTSVIKIVNFFPAGIEVNYKDNNSNTGYTAQNIFFDENDNTTTFEIDVKRIKNPFDIEYSVNADINMGLKPIEVSELRNLKKNYEKYSLYVESLSIEYPIIDFVPTQSIGIGVLEVTVEGKPFDNVTETTKTILLKPNNNETDKSFNENFDEVEKFLINRNTNPIYTANFEVLKEDNNGKIYKDYENLTWKVNGLWNLDTYSKFYDKYLNNLSRIAKDIDDFRANLISRFLTAGTLKDFDTSDQKFESILQIYGRSFDEIKKFIDSLSHVTSVNYNVKNDIPSQLLKNLAQTLGWDQNAAPTNNKDFFNSVFNTSDVTKYGGQTTSKTPLEISYQYYRNLILNSAYLFKSKGTRRSIESLLRMVGAPNALIEFNETIYIADGPISVSAFDSQYLKISGGTKLEEVILPDTTNTFTVDGVEYNSVTTDYRIVRVDKTREDYPIDSNGYPKNPQFSDDFFFQKGSGWYEQTVQHRTNEEIDITNSTFFGPNPNTQTKLEDFTYGRKYLDRYENFPYMDLGFNLSRVIDNKKSWVNNTNGSRISRDGGMISNYYVPSEKLILNTKNIDLSLNMGQGLTYDIWNMSNKYDYPFTSTPLTNPYPAPLGIDHTVVNPKPNKKTFLEFANTFYKNMINVKNRMYIDDAKGGGYPALQYVYWRYMNSESEVGVPSNRYTYQKMIDFTNDIGDYWIKLVEQMIPATTIFTGGQKFENSVLHRQKLAWKFPRKQVEETVEPCIQYEYLGSLFENDCLSQYIECDVTLDTPSLILLNTINQVISENGGDCDTDSIISNWYVNIQLDGVDLINTLYYTGYGQTDYPTSEEWLDAIELYLTQLTNDGLGFTLNRSVDTNTLRVYNLECDSDFYDKTLTVNVGVSIDINC
jgi:hypothetical protein